jgi:Wax ester synthase/diacylglycerol acyltransferase catalytic domain
MTAERLSALDASFLAVEGPTMPMHVGWVAQFDPPEDGPRPAA